MLKAHAVCANCTWCDDFFADPEAVTLEGFADQARHHFADKGWSFGAGEKTLCSDCAQE